MTGLAPPPSSPAATPASLDTGFTRSRSLHNTTARIVNRVMIMACYSAAVVSILALLMIFGYILYKGASSLNVALFTALPGAPMEPGSADYRPTGLRNCIAGTLTLIGMASFVGVPLGMLCGIYLAEYARESRLGHGIRLVVDVLAGVPSIIVGVLAYELVVVPMKTNSAWAGAVALGFMMCPIIAKTTEEMLKLVPRVLREASLGLGASKFQTLFRVVIPSASAGIITGIMLAVARVAGETAPLLFTVLGSDLPIYSIDATFPFVHADLNHAFPSLTVQIFKYATSPEPDWNRQAWAGMLILIVLVLVLNIAVRVVSSRGKYRAA
jgi:phosphate transport system permease protein